MQLTEDTTASDGEGDASEAATTSSEGSEGTPAHAPLHVPGNQLHSSRACRRQLASPLRGCLQVLHMQWSAADKPNMPTPTLSWCHADSAASSESAHQQQQQPQHQHPHVHQHQHQNGSAPSQPHPQQAGAPGSVPLHDPLNDADMDLLESLQLAGAPAACDTAGRGCQTT